MSVRRVLSFLCAVLGVAVAIAGLVMTGGRDDWWVFALGAVVLGTLAVVLFGSSFRGGAS